MTIAVISDLNDSYGSTTYGRHVHDALAFIERLRPDLVICVGDMVAGQKRTLTDPTIQAMWQAFDAHILQRFTRLQIPFAFTFGNHDGSSSPTFARERRLATDFWQRHPLDLRFEDDTQFPHRFSFLFRGVFFASIDASAAKIHVSQQAWLKEQFARPAARTARTRVVLGHLPLYALAQGRNKPGDVLADADSLHQLFCSLGVDYYISGHHHVWYPSRKGSLIMLSAGALGGGPRRLLGSTQAPCKTITVLRLPADAATFAITTHDVTAAMAVLRSTDLPTTVPGFNGVSRRYDPDSHETRAAPAQRETHPEACPARNSDEDR